MTTIKPEHIDLLKHMLGAGSHIKKKNWGYRNMFCAGVPSDDLALMLEMETLGLVKAGCYINEGTARYFHATTEGMAAIGLTKKQIQNAMSP